MSDETKLDAMLTEALERSPEVKIPADFAARVAANVPKRRTVQLHPGRYGWRGGLVALAMLLGLLFSMAPQFYSSTLWAGIELLFCLQFAALLVWLVLPGIRSRS